MAEVFFRASSSTHFVSSGKAGSGILPWSKPCSSCNVMDSYKHLLLTQQMSVWTRLMAETIDWPLVARGAAVILAVNVTLFTLGYAEFEPRDLKS
jgi:hypothetical protein